jgi:DNA (cytosine-5)-methyltransferase 1
MSVSSHATHVDLFAGTGGFSMALKSIGGYDTIYANDIEPNSKKIFDANHSETKLTLKSLIDIPTTDIPPMDFLTGGFPCQPFSIAGLRQGFDDVRSNVFWKLLEIIKHHRPKVFVLENVKNLVSHDGGNTFETIKTALEGADYHLKWQVVNTCKLTNIPQNRERIYIVGFSDVDACERFRFPLGDDECLPVADFLVGEVPDKYYYSDRFVCWELVRKGVVKHVSSDTVYQMRRQYIRENKSGVCPTLTATCGTGGHNVPLILDDRGIRKLLPRECYNLQGFDSEFVLPEISDSALYKLAGNAITVSVAKVIMKAVIDSLH